MKGEKGEYAVNRLKNGQNIGGKLAFVHTYARKFVIFIQEPLIFYVLQKPSQTALTKI